MWERRDKHTEIKGQTEMEGQKQELETETEIFFPDKVYKTLLVPFPFLLALVSWAWEFLSSPSAFQPACGILKLCSLGHIPTGMLAPSPACLSMCPLCHQPIPPVEGFVFCSFRLFTFDLFHFYLCIT